MVTLRYLTQGDDRGRHPLGARVRVPARGNAHTARAYSPAIMESPKRAGPGGHRHHAAIEYALVVLLVAAVVVTVLAALGGQVAAALARATHAFGG
jgi:Flp pilus assembly pilin Flp